MLDFAKRYLRNILVNLLPVIEAGAPVVVLEPSCAAVFRDELIELFPNDEDAKRLHDTTFVLSEFLNHLAPDYRPPRVDARAIFHGHCHQKSVIGLQDEMDLLKRMGVDVEQPEPGCCGLAGSFGFEAGKYQVSMAIGEQRLLPAVRGTAGDTIVIADGFSCHTQIEQGTGRKPMHLAEVIAQGLPARQDRGDAPDSLSRTAKRALIAGGAVLATGLLLPRLIRRLRSAAASPERHYEVETAQ